MDAWREILRRYIEDPKEKRRIANNIGILSLRTLDRWAEGLSTPKNVQVIHKLSQQELDLEKELRIAFPDAFKRSQEDTLFMHQTQSVDVELPKEFYFRTLHAYATIPMALKEWTITNLVGEQLVHHLDPDGIGMAVVFAQCVPKENVIHSFLAKDVGGSGIWDTRRLVSQKTIWGGGSLINAVATDRRPYFIQALSDDPQRLLEFESFFQKEKIASLAAYPVQREGALAGVLVICASQPDFFTGARRKLMGEYTQLYALAFSDQDFYGHLTLNREELPRQEVLSTEF